MSAAQQELDSSLTKLSLSTARSSKKKAVADSWEDDEDASGSENGKPLTTLESRDYPSAPPPTPISPLSPTTSRHREYTTPFSETWNSGSTSPRINRDEARRPEKTVSAASRMIAMGLGQKVPKKTEEQRAYDRAVKEKEIKRRNAEKEDAKRAEEEAARAKAAVWDE